MSQSSVEHPRKSSSTPKSIAKIFEQPIIRNTAFNLAGSALPLVSVALFIPILMRELGNERFGLITLILAILGYANALNFGLGRAVTYYSVKHITEGKTNEIANLSIIAAIIQLIIGTLGGVILFALATTIAGSMKFSSEVLPDAILSFRWMSVIIPVVMVTSTYRGLLEGAQRFAAINAIVGPLGVVDLFLPVVATYLNQPVSTIVILLLISRLVALILQFALCANSYESLLTPPHSVRDTTKKLFSYGGWIALTDIAFPVFTYLDRFLIATISGISAVPSYVIPYEIVTRLWIIPTSLGKAVFPIVSSDTFYPNSLALQQMYAKGMRLMITGVIPISALVVLFGDDLLDRWISNSFSSASSTVLRVLVLSFVLNCLAVMGSAIIQGQGMPRQRAQLLAIEVPTYLVAAWLLIPQYGAVGAAWAEVCRMIVTMVLIGVALKRNFGLGVKHALGNQPKTLTIVLIICFLVSMLAGGASLMPKAAILAIEISLSLYLWLRADLTHSIAESVTDGTQ